MAVFFDRTCTEALGLAEERVRAALANPNLGNDPVLSEDPSDEDRAAHDAYERAQEDLLSAQIAVEDAKNRMGCL